MAPETDKKPAATPPVVGSLTGPSERRANAGTGHVCELKAQVGEGENAKVIDLTKESEVRAAGIAEGTVFTCQMTVKRDGKDVACGKQHRLHFPKPFGWKLMRPRTEETATA